MPCLMKFEQSDSFGNNWPQSLQTVVKQCRTDLFFLSCVTTSNMLH